MKKSKSKATVQSTIEPSMEGQALFCLVHARNMTEQAQHNPLNSSQAEKLWRKARQAIGPLLVEILREYDGYPQNGSAHLSTDRLTGYLQTAYPNLQLSLAETAGVLHSLQQGGQVTTKELLTPTGYQSVWWLAQSGAGGSDSD